MSNHTTQEKLLPTFFRPYVKRFWAEQSSTTHACLMPEYHYHNYYEIYYLRRGKRYYFVEDKTFLIEEGSFVFINKYNVHLTTAFRNSGYERILVLFTDDFINDISAPINNLNLLSCFNGTNPTLRLSPDDRQIVESILLSILDEYASQRPGCADYLRCLLLQLLIFISRRDTSTKSLQRNKNEKVQSEYINFSHKTISEISGYVNNHYKEDLSLSDISEKFFLSKSYIARIFKKFAGITFTNYVNNIRIKEAQRLIHETDMNMTQISEEVGYKSYTHFAREFKNLVGISPYMYTRNNRK